MEAKFISLKPSSPTALIGVGIVLLTSSLSDHTHVQGADPVRKPPPTLEETIKADFFGSDRARKTLRAFPSRGALPDFSIPPKSPHEAVEAFKVMEGLEVEVVLHEPTVTQPVFLNFDERGRMWVVQFIQYPYPAGLKILDFDDQFHAVYDKVPPPPPNQDRGADRISIHEDRNGDGTFESHQVFVEGLNMVTSVERGRGGMWVLNPPYLLFYPDLDGNDIPDSDPRVHLAGFGLEDTHSAANSMRWGPDGWLYAAQGSGVSSTIRRPGIDNEKQELFFRGQAIWRYHPERRVFELFSEGGGNTFSLEMDGEGRTFSGNNGAGARGYHFVQGGYYRKNFGEHGYLTNPYAFGYFGSISHDQDIPRFSHTLLVYEGGALGPRFEGRIMAPDALHHRILLTERFNEGSTFKTRDLGRILESDDRWFRPVDIKVGPDGAVYVADWYDTRLTHMDPRDNWDRQHGRIYRIKASGAKPIAPFDLSTRTSAELITVLGHENKWFRQQALRLLADRKDRSVITKLRQLACAPNGRNALDALWALHAVGGFTDRVARDLIAHPQPGVRRWAVRLVGESTSPPETSTAALMASMARQEPQVEVRSQLASTAKRLPANAALPILLELMKRDEDIEDSHIPLLIWWALEDKSVSDRALVLSLFADPGFWKEPMMRHHIVSRLARRYAAFPDRENQEALALLLRSAPGRADKNLVTRGINEAFKGRSIEGLIASLEHALDQPDTDTDLDPTQLALALRRGDPRALPRALSFITVPDPATESQRIEIIELLGEVGCEEATPVLLEILGREESHEIRSSTLTALGRFQDEELAEDILTVWARLDGSLRQQAAAVLCSRTAWARSFLGSIGGSGAISKKDIPDALVKRMRLLGDEKINRMADRYFGESTQATSEEKQRLILELTQILQSGTAGRPPAGKQLFAARCGACHQLFGEGADLGPDLTGYERTHLDNMLLNIVDPNMGIREGYTLFQFTTEDERTLLGYIQDRDATQVKLRDPAGQTTTLAQNRIREERPIKTSLMPEGLLNGLSDQQLKDLFAYLMSDAGAASK